ncbi:hypothetical protein KSP40_PGU000216 [Platanthera guangdongensis]|uniref:Uncharacterized protein n=1 Tax=Platanthera guangdongensis TaxID=2320717 RepID=A0ABR2LR02_9ASPA
MPSALGLSALSYRKELSAPATPTFQKSVLHPSSFSAFKGPLFSATLVEEVPLFFSSLGLSLFLKKKLVPDLALVRSTIEKASELAKRGSEISSTRKRKFIEGLSPAKANRIAKLRECFADTIFKAQQELQKYMEVSVEIDDFNDVVKEMMGFGCQSLSFYVLRRLGLYLKDDDYDVHHVDLVPAMLEDDMEEGEIHKASGFTPTTQFIHIKIKQ